jgi:hypothetical protein
MTQLFNDGVFAKLTSLNVASCHDLTDSTVCAIALHCPRLQSLDLARCAKISDVGVEYLADQLWSLRHLDLSYLTLLSETSLIALVSLSFPPSLPIFLFCHDFVRVFAHENTNLRQAQSNNPIHDLRLSHLCSIASGDKSPNRYTSIQDVQFRRHLPVTWCSPVTARCLQYVANGLRIHRLDLSGIQSVDDEGIHALCTGRWCSALRF